MTSPTRPMLPVTGPVPSGSGWAFEFAWDGIRCLADVDSERVRLISANGHSIGSGYPELDVLAARAGGRRLLLDGKIVALDACDRPSFERLQRRMHRSRPSAQLRRCVPVSYYAFDLLRLDDEDTYRLPYWRRRELLEDIGLAGDPVVLPPYFLDTQGQAVLDTAAQYGLSGVVAKRAESPYRPGRCRSWVETTLRQRQEVIIGGWVAGRGEGVGSLLVGVPTECGLRFVGHVGTGLTDAVRRDLANRLTELEQPASPFAEGLPQHRTRTVHWAAPALLGEVTYRSWTHRGRLGHPSWRGLRPGKHPAAVRPPVLLRATDIVHSGHPELRDAVRRARAEVRALRSQFSPHFLYNALNAIVALVRTDPDRARELLADFAHFTRYSLREAVEFTTLDEELENIEHYLALEHARLGERLNVSVRVAPSVLGVRLPFLALQLLVMSAVRHGIESAPHGGTLTLSAVEDGADCLITVADDGPGAAPDLGLVADRLRSTRGRDYDLSVDAVPDTGTTVVLRAAGLPVAGSQSS